MSYLTSYLKEKYTDYVTLLVTPNTVDRLAGGKNKASLSLSSLCKLFARDDISTASHWIA